MLGQRVSIGEYAVIGAGARLATASLSARTVWSAREFRSAKVRRLLPGVTIYPGATLGARTIVHAGVRIGSDGFGYVFRDGAHNKIPHVGRCIIEDDVEIGANTHDRSRQHRRHRDRRGHQDRQPRARSRTTCASGRLCLLMAQVGIAGSATIEDGAILAGQAGIAGHIRSAQGARIAAQAGVFGDVPAGRDAGRAIRRGRTRNRSAHQAALFKLAGMMRRLEQLLERSRRPE